MIQNRRDLGGLKTKDGRIIRSSMLIRSAHLHEAMPEDLRGISAVIDLRTPQEREEAPDKTYGAECLPMPIFDGTTAGISHENGQENHLFPDMSILYRRLMTECTASFASVLNAIVRHDFSSGAVLWHCSEGKDRCGMTTALVLELLGVDRDVIVHDYLKTNETNLPKAARYREELAPKYGKAFADSIYQAYIADEKYIRSAWDAMGPGYLEKLDLPKEAVDTFRAAVLQKARS